MKARAIDLAGIRGLTLCFLVLTLCLSRVSFSATTGGSAITEVLLRLDELDLEIIQDQMANSFQTREANSYIPDFLRVVREVRNNGLTWEEVDLRGGLSPSARVEISQSVFGYMREQKRWRENYLTNKQIEWKLGAEARAAESEARWKVIIDESRASAVRDLSTIFELILGDTHELAKFEDWYFGKGESGQGNQVTVQSYESYVQLLERRRVVEVGIDDVPSIYNLKGFLNHMIVYASMKKHFASEGRKNGLEGNELDNFVRGKLYSPKSYFRYDANPEQVLTYNKFVYFQALRRAFHDLTKPENIVYSTNWETLLQNTQKVMAKVNAIDMKKLLRNAEVVSILKEERAQLLPRSTSGENSCSRVAR